MAGTIQLLPSRFQPCEPSLGRRPRKLFNPIIEEDCGDGQLQIAVMGQQRRQGDTLHLKIEAWLSPISDHFPTPRGIHYLSAPVLPSSPSTLSGDGSSPTTTSTNMWNRASIATENTEFEDLYDVSEEEDDAAMSMCYEQPSVGRTSHGRAANQPVSKQPTRLVIPANTISVYDEARSAVHELKKITTPVPITITPSAQLPMAPAQIDFMGKQQALEIPTISAPPSLDGSISSEQFAVMSAPPTPIIGNDEDVVEQNWTGVHLQPDALATLQALSGGDEDIHERPSQVIDISMTAPQTAIEMLQPPQRLMTISASQSIQATIFDLSPTRNPCADLTRLDIPSPGGFFSRLSPRTRSTWHPPTQSPADEPPPTSTTAEQFYRCPWNIDTSVTPVPMWPNSGDGFCHSVNVSLGPVKQVIEVKDGDRDDLTDGLPTARPTVPHQDSNGSGDAIKAHTSPNADEAPTEIVVDYDPDYARKQQKVALSNLGRTELWLLAQRTYLKGVGIGEDSAALKAIEESSGDEEEDEVPDAHFEAEQSLEVKKKVVRFSNMIPTTSLSESTPSKVLRRESAYYRAFQDYVVRAQLRDVFVQQLSRFESLQAQRTALRGSHRSQLLGKYQLSVIPQSAKKRLSANVARGDLVLVDDPEKLRKEKEYEAMDQMTISTWHVAALKFLNGGRLISAPVTKKLARLFSTGPGGKSVTRNRARVLDLGGQSTCDWAWHCALQYPNTKVYTVTTKAIRQLSNSNIRGPPNHRQVAVERLTRLPFADDQFDLVSAREIHGILKFMGENGEDEWESCLRECMRVLKPGGYLEFSIMDSDIVNAGPLGLAKSVEFGFTLRTLGYDPSPSKLWIGRLARAGFDDIRRAWLCLPMGAKRKVNIPSSPPMKDSVTTKNGMVCNMEAMAMGSSDNVANICSMAGGWSWERWLLRCEMEKVAGEMRLVDTVTTGAAMNEAGKCLDGVHAVMEEGRNCKAGFRVLNGYARKPKRNSDVIQIVLAN